MKLFGRDFKDYVGFAKPILALVFLVWLVRFALSLAGVPNASVKWVSATAITVLSVFYFGIRVHTRGFGSYKELFGLILTTNVFQQLLVIVGILTAMVTGKENIFSAAEYSSGMGASWMHVGGHIIVSVVGAVVLWLVGCIVLAATKALAQKKAAA